MNSSEHRFFSLYLYDTCTFNCGYCELAEKGLVADKDQLKRLDDDALIKKIINFFTKTSSEKKWHVSLTGGEPLIMPKLSSFLNGLFSEGNTVSIYTNLSIPENHPNMKYLLNKKVAKNVEYMMCSLHPENLKNQDNFFRKIKKLNEAKHNIVVRFVGHPKLMTHIPELEKKCIEQNISFFPTPLSSYNYPGKYTSQERELLGNHIKGISSWIQLEGGLDVRNKTCYAGNKLFAGNLKDGNIYPCISTDTPLLGNIFKGHLKSSNNTMKCSNKNKICSCDAYFQHNLVVGVDDSKNFNRLKKGYVSPYGIKNWEKTKKQLNFSFGKKFLGQGGVKNDKILAYNRKNAKNKLRNEKIKGIILRFLKKTGLK